MQFKFDFDQFMLNLRSRKVWFSWLMVTLGALIMSAGFVFFTNPYKIIPGGVYGLGRVLHYLVPSIQTGTFGFMFDIPLMIIGLLVFGSAFGAKTVFAACIAPVFMNVMTSLVGENPADKLSIIGQYIDFSDNLLVVAIFGGVLIGVGVGVIVKAGATSGGTDIVAMLGNKFLKLKFSTALFIVESSIVVIGMIVFKDWQMPFYALVVIFVEAKAIDLVLEGASSDKLIFIVSNKQKELRDFILDEMGRGATYIKSSGMYTNEPKDMVFLVVSRNQLSKVQDKVREIDSESFLVVVNATETYGNGFKPFVK